MRSSSDVRAPANRLGARCTETIVKIAISAERCTGHGLCYLHSPDVYQPDDEGYVAARGQTIEVPVELEEDALKGVRSCPERAISVVTELPDTI